MSTISLSPTLEDYLEAILQIISRNKVARSMEIAERLKVKRSSVTIALRSLAEKGLINYQVRSYVTLTEKGMDAARCVDRRHHLLYRVFKDILKLPENEADKVACTMEHGMSSEVCKKMTAFMMAMEKDDDSANKIMQLVNSFEQKIDCNKDCGYRSKNGEEKMENSGDLNLNSLLPGEEATIYKVKDSGTLKKRLMEIGIMRGEKIVVIKAAPLDDPIEIKVKNTHLSLRRDEAEMILIKR